MVKDKSHQITDRWVYLICHPSWGLHIAWAEICPPLETEWLCPGPGILQEEWGVSTTVLLKANYVCTRRLKKKKNPRKWSVANCCLEVGGSQGVCTWTGTKSVSNLLDWEFSFEKSTSQDLWELSSSAPGQKINGSEDQQGKPSKSEAPCLWLCGLTGGNVAGCASLQGAWGLHSLCLRRSHVTEKEKIVYSRSQNRWQKRDGRVGNAISTYKNKSEQQSQEQIQKRNKQKTNMIDINACKSTAILNISCLYITIKGQTLWGLIQKQDPRCLKQKKPTYSKYKDTCILEAKAERNTTPQWPQESEKWLSWQKKISWNYCALEGTGPWEGAVPYSLIESRTLDSWFHPRVAHPTHTEFKWSQL